MENKSLFYRSKNVNYKIVGDGSPMMLIHGYQADSRIWDLLVPLLSKKYRLYIPDLPGHGSSPLIQQINTMEFLADIVYRICLSEAITNLIIVGHSMGGYVALAFANIYSQYVDGLVLINSHPFDDGVSQKIAHNREAELIEHKKKYLLLMSYAKNNFADCENPVIKANVDKAIKIALEQSDEGMMADLSGIMSRSDLSDSFNNVRFPVNFVYGSNDGKVPIDRIKTLAFPNINISKIDGCGHLCIVEHPEKVAALILATSN